jgi:hypothetical protein
LPERVQLGGRFGWLKSAGLWKPLMVLVAVSATWGGACGPSGTVPVDWVDIQGDGVSLRLPGTYYGGDPADPKVVAAFREDGYEIQAEQPPEGVEVLLAASGPRGSYDFAPRIMVLRGLVPSGMSMEEWIDYYLSHSDGYSIESLVRDRAIVISKNDYDGTTYAVRVFMSQGSQGCIVSYACDAESSAAFDSVFKTSAQTIAVQW